MSTTIVDTVTQQEPEYVYFHYDGKYGHRREVLNGVKQKSTFTEIPLVDIDGIFSEDPAQHLCVAREIAKACKQCGFFYIKNHGVEQDLIDETFNTTKDYFDQPLEKKMEQWIYKNKDLKGYEPVHGARLDDTKPKGDRKESFLLSYDPAYDPVPPVLNARQKELMNVNAFPPEPEFKRKIHAYHSRLMILARQLTRSFALGLGTEKYGLDSMVTAPNTNMKILHYPPQDPESMDETGIGAHTDFTMFTILNQDSVGGLEVLNANAHWVPATPTPGTFVVNVGDFLMRLSNEEFVSTVHRVNNTSGKERYAIPFFWTMNLDAAVEPLKSCTSEDNPPKFQPLTVGEYYEHRHNIQRARYKARGIGQ